MQTALIIISILLIAIVLLQAGKAERQPKVIFHKPPRFLRRLFAGFWANGTKKPEENGISFAL